MKSIADIRTEYTKSSLDVSSVDGNGITQFRKWFDEAVRSDAPEPNAMNLSTVSGNGTPSSRIVLLKGVENNALLFFTNYQSQKGRELETNPACALTFFWPSLERQVRVVGIAQKISIEASEKYFQSRPRKSQIAAWASPQSVVIGSREILDLRVSEIKKRFEGNEVLPKPNQWGGFAVTPASIEFWQGRPDRLHDRILFTREHDDWKIVRLAP